MPGAIPNPREKAFSAVFELGHELDVHARRVANQERRLLTLLELGREAAETLDEPGLCSVGLLTLMGYVGTSQAAMWTCEPASSDPPRLAGSHGVQPAILEAITPGLPGFGRSVQERGAPAVAPITGMAEWLDEVTTARLRGARLSTICALVGGGEVIGFVVLGEPVGATEGSGFDRAVLGAACGILGVSLVNTRLIAQLRARGEDLLRANEELAELDRLKSDFLSNINHELRTPVAVIQGAASCLRLPGIDPAEAVRFVEMIEVNAAALGRMIQTLLDFSVLGSSHAPVALDIVQLDDVAGTYHCGRQAKVEQGGRRLAWEPPSQPVIVRGDEKRIYEILDRLVENATRFTPPGSRITVRVRREGGREDACGLLEVEDDGPGIEAGKLDRVFRPFEQGDGSTTRSVGGLGIGLAVARRQAELMGGTLDVASEPGHGARFTLRLRLG